jgi:hypothetical protein
MGTLNKSRENPLNPSFDEENQKLMGQTPRVGKHEEGTYIKNPNEVHKLTLSAIKDSDAVNMADPKISRVFPLKDRIMKSISCCGNKEDWIPYLLKQPPKLTLSQLPKLETDKSFSQPREDMALKIKIKSTGSLDLDEHVLHPFVRVHVIDMSTQKYLAKEENVPCMQTRESVSLVDAGKNFQRQRGDFVQPFSTSLTDLRRKGQMMAEWEDEFVINERVAKVMEPEVVLLFELLDFCPDLAMTQPELLN